MTIWATHPFARRTLNPLNENGEQCCAFCGRPFSFHRDNDNQQEEP